MPLYTIKEIASICGMQPKNVHVYISRGKLVKRKDSLIDTTNEINEAFISLRRKDNPVQDEVVINTEIEKPEVKKVKQQKVKTTRQRKKSKEDS